MAAEAKYQQIADSLRERIQHGEIAQGAQLPTEIELMAEYQASRNTVRDAIKLLVNRRLVETRAGQGTFVVEQINPFVSVLTEEPDRPSIGGGDVYVSEVEASGREPTSGPLRVEIQQANAVIADVLRVPEGSQVISRHQQRFIDGTPWVLQTTFYPMHLVDQGARRLLEATNIFEGTVRYLAECGIKQVGYRDSISVRAPDENETAFFRLPADGRIQVFVHFRVGFDQNGQRFRVTITVYPSDRNRFVVNVGQVPPRGQAGRS